MEPDKYLEESAKRLEKILTKQMTTIMIGALNSVETTLLDKLKLEELSLTQAEIEELWKETRKKILDIGNKQINNAKEELSFYTISWNRYRYQIKFNKGN